MWHEFHGPLAAFAVSLVLALVARLRRSTLAGSLACGLAVAAGWYVMRSAPLRLAPLVPMERLLPLSVATLLVALAAERFAARRGVWPPLVVTALGCGWWMAGGPLTQAGLLAVWPVILVVAVAVVAVTRLSGIAAGATSPLPLALAAFTLAMALHVVGAPWIWILMALTPGAAVLPLLLVPRLAGLALLPLAADLAATKAAVSLSIGRLAHGGLGAVDAAALSPLLALWLMPHAVTRLRRFGRLGPLLAAVVCGAIAVGATWGVLWLRR
ncbi:MAG: hypothetical protein P4L71_17025 [Acetobacteraceae bacterium]|nr:hypothetical protein [Acetobacteraceae bacterium]